MEIPDGAQLAPNNPMPDDEVLAIASAFDPTANRCPTCETFGTVYCLQRGGHGATQADHLTVRRHMRVLRLALEKIIQQCDAGRRLKQAIPEMDAYYLIQKTAEAALRECA